MPCAILRAIALRALLPYPARMTLAVAVETAAVALAVSLPGGAAAADVVAVVSSRSAVTALSKAQLADIFLGKVNRFPDGTPAMPIDQPEGSPQRDAFYANVAGKSPAQIKSHWAKLIFTGRGQSPRTESNDAEMIKAIATHPQAIGYIDRSAVDSSVKVLIDR
jgi:ABC-type phosphate transport system substrate-binding protein